VITTTGIILALAFILFAFCMVMLEREL